jgi:replicative DNA helicase
MGSSSKRADSREREIAELSGGLKALAKELEVPVIALAQLNRGPDTRTDHRPKTSDLRESGSLEQDADMIMFIYRDEYYNKNSEFAGKAEIIIAKNRHGSVDTVMLAYQPNFVSFYNLMK